MSDEVQMEETELLIPEPNDVRTIAYLLLIGGYTIRAETTMITHWNGPFRGPTTIESVRLFYHKTPNSKIINLSSNSDEKYESDLRDEEENPMYTCTKTVEGLPCILTAGHTGDCLVKCNDPNCPGYPWVARDEIPHPTNTCKPHCAPKKKNE